MKEVFVWNDVSGLTCNYHDGGGVTVVADNLDVARQLLKDYNVKDHCEVYTEIPDFTAPVVTEENQVFIFPDAGCC